MVSLYVFHAVIRRFAPQPSNTKDHHKNGTNCLPAWHACIRVGVWQCRLTVLKAGYSVWNCLWEHALKQSGINRKSGILYPGPRFLSCATWPLIPKKHYNGWLIVFYVPLTTRSFRDGTPIYCRLRRTWSSVFTPFPLGIEPQAVAWQSITQPLHHASSTTIKDSG